MTTRGRHSHAVLLLRPGLWRMQWGRRRSLERFMSDVSLAGLVPKADGSPIVAEKPSSTASPPFFEFMPKLTADDTYAPLLRVGLDDPPSNTEEQVTHADVLPPQAKAAMVLEARGDLLDAERGLREIEVLEKRGVAGAETLEGESLLPPLPSTPPTPSSFLPPTPSFPASFTLSLITPSAHLLVSNRV